MAFSYRPLWHTLIDRDITPRELRDGAGLSQETLTRMKQGQGGRLETLDKICGFLSCPLAAVIEYVPEATHEDAQEATQQKE